MWSTIKTLPATLPEPSFKDGLSSAGVTGAVHHSDLDTCQWVGADNRRGCCALGPWFWDWRLEPAQSLKEGFLLDVRLIAF